MSESEKLNGINEHLRMDSVEEDPLLVEYDPEARFHRYKEQIAEGRFKTVYRGYDTENGIDVAWCKVRSDESSLNTIYSEMQKGLTLDHPNIIKCYCCWIDSEDQSINLITELFTSGTLREYRETYSNVDVKVHRKHIRQILHGLQYLHSRKPAVVHADIRLDKIYVNGFNGEVKLGDLGIGMLLAHRYDESDMPEIDSPLSDLHAVGICSYELITGYKLHRKTLAGSIEELQQLEKIKDLDAKDFIIQCFSTDESLTAENLLQHPFLKSKSPGMKIQNGGEKEESTAFHAHNQKVGTKLRGEDWNFEFCGYKSEDDEDENVHIRLVMSNETESDHVTTLDFDYNLETDTPESVGGDIADSFSLSITDRELCKAALREWLSVMVDVEATPPRSSLSKQKEFKKDSQD